MTEHDVQFVQYGKILPLNRILSVFVRHSTDNVTRETLWKNLIFQRYHFFLYVQTRLRNRYYDARNSKIKCSMNCDVISSTLFEPRNSYLDKRDNVSVLAK